MMAVPDLSHVTAWGFVCGLFGTRDANQVWAAQSGDFTGGFATSLLMSFGDATTHYVSLSTMMPGSKARSLANFKAFHLLTLDDVGVISDTTDALMDRDIVAMFAPPPSAVVETSRANHQVSFKISPPEPDVERATLFLEALKRTPFGPGVAPMSVVHYVRTPSGENTKPNKKGFRTKLKLWAPEVSYTLDELAAHFGLPADWDTPVVKTINLGPRETLPNETIIEVMRIIPNTFATFPTYEDWIRAGNIFKGAAADPNDPDLADAWVRWSDQMAQSKADPAVKWETFEPDMTHAGSLRNLIAKHASHPKEGEKDFAAKERRALEADKLDLGAPAASVFEVIEDGTVPPPSAVAKAATTRGLIDELRAARSGFTEY